jgi:hypothetical protein
MKSAGSTTNHNKMARTPNQPIKSKKKNTKNKYVKYLKSGKKPKTRRLPVKIFPGASKTIRLKLS